LRFKLLRFFCFFSHSSVVLDFWLQQNETSNK